MDTVTTWKSESIAALAAALAAAQGEMGGAAKSATNPHFKSKYADLASVVDASRGQLAKNGLAVVQFAESDGATAMVTTILTHKSGEWMRGTIVLRPIKTDPQGIGSALTYGRRYGLAAMVGIAPEDDDGNAASHAPGQVNGQRATPGRSGSGGNRARMLDAARKWSALPAEELPAVCQDVARRVGVKLSPTTTDADFGKVADAIERYMGDGTEFPLPPPNPPPGEDISDYPTTTHAAR